MASPQDQAEQVKIAVASIATCTPAATVLVKELLLSKDNDTPEAGTQNPHATKPTRSTSTRRHGATSRTTEAKKAAGEDKAGLSTKEKAMLATHIINITLKSLGEAAKASPLAVHKMPTGEEDLVRSAAKRHIRRSNSTPMTPMQPRSLNRVSTSPDITKKSIRTPSRSNAFTDCLSTVECARVAFSALRSLQKASKITLPELQLEAGMSSLVGKLIGLGLTEHAVKELRLLKRRLDELLGSGKGSSTTTTSGASTFRLWELLEFEQVQATGQLLNLVLSTQMQVLRILSKVKRPMETEGALPLLRPNSTSSPMNMLLRTAGSGEPEKAKAARQLETLSQLLISLVPSTSSSEDETASEPKLSISPQAALELQTIALQSRLSWWRLAGHKADVDKDILAPFSKCIAAYVRRTQRKQITDYKGCLAAVDIIYGEISTQNLEPSNSSKRPLASIYQTLSKLAREVGHIDDAISWTEKSSQLVDRSQYSAAKACSTSALLLSYRLKMPWKYPVQDLQVKEVLEGLQGQLRGDSSELDELLESLIMALKSTVKLLFGGLHDENGNKYMPPTDFIELLESLILQLPRFCLRWLGKQPSSPDDTRGFLRYEQRRTVLVKSAPQILDSALLLAKTNIAGKGMSWDKLDVLLHDCVGLLDGLGDQASVDPSNYYYAKISHLYYVQHTNFMNTSKTSKADAKENMGLALRAMRRSIDCVKHRTSNERQRAQIIFKLERASELYRDTGRPDDALASLQTLRAILIEDGVLVSVAQALKTLPPRQAWAISQDAESLSWSLRSIARTEHVWVDWTLHLDEPERLAALEHRLDLILSKKVATSGTVGLSEPCVEALLQLCSVEKYPVRRLRILIRLLVANVGNAKELEAVQAQMREVVAVNDVGEDAGLRGTLSHMKALSESMFALASHPPDYNQIEQAMGTWQSILDSSQGATELEGRIDDVPGLLEHLQSVADCARLSNCNSLMLTALQLAADIGRKAARVDTSLNLQISAALALQLTNVGQSSKATTVLEQAKQSFQTGKTPGHEEMVRFLLAHAEYFIEIGNIENAGEILGQAKEVASAIDLSARSRSRRLMLAQASLMYSCVALGRGDAPGALTYARNASRVLFQEWLRLEKQGKSVSPNKPSSSADESAINMDASVAEGVDRSKDISSTISGPEAWKLAHPVMRGLLFLSNTYAHLGMYQETVYYAEQARKVAQAAGSEALLVDCDAWMSSIFARAGKLEDALKSVSEVKSRLDGDDYSSKLIALCCQLSNIYREAKDFESEKSMIETAEAMVRRMAGRFETKDGVLEVQDAMAIDSKVTRLPVRTPRTTTTTTLTRKARVPAPMAATKKATTTKPELALPESLGTEDAHLASLRASVIVEKASSMIYQRDWTGAWELLQGLHQSSNVASHVVSELVTAAKSLLGQSMDQMAKDAVYSVIQESTLSFPSVCTTSFAAQGSDRFSMFQATPPPKVIAPPAFHEKDVLQPPHGYLENLREARGRLLEAHALASVMGDGREVHKILSMLQTVVILLSAASPSPRKAGIVGHPGYATCSIEMARNLTWRREYKALLTEKRSGRDGLEWPEDMRPAEDRRTSLNPVVDMSRFQREYIDIIPQEWTVISISLSDNKHDLCISRLQTGQSPYVIRLPLERATSRDADNEVFNFQQGRAELLDIIKQANATCHTKRDFSVKGAKTAWWAEREALDVRLKELLLRIEQVWLGGFKGIFSQHQRHSDLLAKFEENFENILDKHLPSRRQIRGKKTKAQEASTKVTLDRRILELFIGLGDDIGTDSDFDEMLNDLLYFVVDILQFHGERNAYDEIDFDSMVVETLDALRSYHDGANSLDSSKTRSHTVLVLDKALHTFPWESLPSLQGLAVSRVPSLACLRRLILEQQSPSTEVPKSDGTGHPAGHYASINSGTYMLNTSGDLKTTQATFEAPLSSLDFSWRRIVKKAPTEAEFETALSSSDILLYMGHGGGAQYIRNRTVRRLDKCRATALLMGCSSASLADVGDFECYGLVWSYMLAGCPAVVGTLWDVTDRDIDLYTGRLYEEWGLVARGSFPGRGEAAVSRLDDSTEGDTRKAARGGSRKKAAGGGGGGGSGGDTVCEYGDASLPEAVARAKNSGICKFRYLNAAAVCVYGIPVYVDRGGR